MSVLHQNSPNHASLQINLADSAFCESWIRKLVEAITPETTSLDVFFLGGGNQVNPSVILALRNALLALPDSVTIRTVAMGSMSPFFCAVWLVGDQRWISSDARLWIPKLPEPILRGREARQPLQEIPSPLTRLRPASRDEDHNDDTPDRFPSDSADLEALPKPGTREHACMADSHPHAVFEEDCGCRRCRMIAELRSLASVINEWFPCWEFAGRGITPQELVELRVIRPNWIFGGQASKRSAARHIDSTESAEVEDGKSEALSANPEGQ